jgi:hypothetical protein
MPSITARERPEPNVKESPGLRDYHTALWVGATRVGARSLDDLAAAGIIAAAERHAVAQAYEFRCGYAPIFTSPSSGKPMCWRLRYRQTRPHARL